LKARVLDETLKASWPKRADSRRDINNDTITFYMYYPKTSTFFGTIEYLKNNKKNLNFVYRFDSTGLRRITVYKSGGSFNKKLYANYYFENNTLFYKESHGLPIDQETYLLNRGINFFQNAQERFKGPKFN
jgi:hypothetical protein